MRYYYCMSTKHLVLGILIGLGTLAFGAPSLAQGPGPEFGAEKLPADVAEARRQDFQIVDWTKVPKAECEGSIRQLVDQLRSWDRHFGPFGIECARANVTGGRWPDLLVDLRGADPDLNDSPPRRTSGLGAPPRRRTRQLLAGRAQDPSHGDRN